MERTYIMIKPDGVQRGLVGRIIARFEDRGLKLTGLKMLTAGQDLLMEHYAELKVRPIQLSE
jgi:nucleoside-diphosphate kinase